MPDGSTVLPVHRRSTRGRARDARTGRQGRGGGGRRFGHRCGDRASARMPRARRWWSATSQGDNAAGGGGRGARRRAAGRSRCSSTSPTTTSVAALVDAAVAEYGAPRRHARQRRRPLPGDHRARHRRARRSPLERVRPTRSQVNLRGHLLCTRHALPHLLATVAAVRSCTPARRPVTSASPSGRRTRRRRPASTRWCATWRRTGAARGSGPTRSRPGSWSRPRWTPACRRASATTRSASGVPAARPARRHRRDGRVPGVRRRRVGQRPGPQRRRRRQHAP